MDHQDDGGSMAMLGMMMQQGKTAPGGWRVKVPVRTQMGRQGHQEVTYAENPRVVVEERAPWVCVCFLVYTLGMELGKKLGLLRVPPRDTVSGLLGCWCGPHCLISGSS